MSEFIKREAVMKAFADFVWNSNHSDLVPAPTWNQAVDIVRDFPADDVAPVRHGRWLKHGYSCPCSNCGYDLGYSGTPMELTLAFFKYCPNCGAKMDGGET